jgi:ABC-2 type transport system permease protein
MSVSGGLPPGSAVGDALQALVGSRSRLVLVAVTVLVGTLVAFGQALGLPFDQRTFARVVPLTQLAISVLTPFSTALLTHDLRTVKAPVGSRWVAAGIYGLLMGALGAAASAAAVAVGSGGPLSTVDPWTGAWSAALGSLVFQLIPVGVGCGAGLLISRARRAQIATLAVPLAVSFLLGRYAPAGATDWVTPLGAATHLLPGPMTALHWVQWVVTAALWVVLPNVIGARLLRRRRIAAAAARVEL